MNELNRIHLAKVPYEIEQKAYAVLKEYIKEIESRVGAEVVAEVEVRMTEILAERSTVRDGVIVMADVDAIKAQLGTPDQFGESAEEKPQEPVAKAPRRLMRDEDNAMVGGVAAGLGTYFSVDPVFIRLAFAALALAAGGSVVIYAAAWMIIPAAKSDADRLRMRGSEVTVESLAKFREGMARVSTNLKGRGFGSSILLIARVLIGLSFLAVAFGLLMAMVALHFVGFHMSLFGFFPSVGSDYLILGAADLAAFSLLALMVWTAAAFLRGKTPATGSRFVGYGLLAMLFLGFIVSFGVIGATYPDLQQRYDKAVAKRVKPLASFEALSLKGAGAYRYVATTGQPRIEAPVRLDGTYPLITAEVKDGTLTLSQDDEAPKNHSWSYYLRDHRHDDQIIIYGPSLKSIKEAATVNLDLTGSQPTDSLAIDLADQSGLTVFDEMALKELVVTATGSAQLSAASIVASHAVIKAGSETGVQLGGVTRLELTGPERCSYPLVELSKRQSGDVAVVNGKETAVGSGYDDGSCIVQSAGGREY